MERKVILAVLAFAAIALVAGIFLPPLFVEPPARTDLPWQVGVTAQGATRVFGITLGETTLREAQTKFLSESEVTLFSAPDGSKMVEAYFDSVSLSGLSAKVVLGIGVAGDEADRMYERGLRNPKLASGTEKISLVPEDFKTVLAAPVETITYMPSINLTEDLAAKRFGEPAEKRREPESGVVHWLYPRIGLDIAFSETEKEVLQYVLPAEFERLSDPLEGTESIP